MRSERGGFQIIQILSLLGMYIDAVVVEFKSFLLLFRLALAILWVFFTLGLKVEFIDLPHFLEETTKD